MFYTLNTEEYRQLCLHKYQRQFDKGEIIVSQGEKADKFLYLKNGLAKIFLRDRNEERIIRLSKPLDFLSVVANFAHDEFPYSIQAITPTTVCFFDLQKIKDTIGQNGNFGLELLKKISGSCNNAILMNMELNRRNLRGRVAYILLLLANDIYQRMTFELPLTRREIGEIISMSTENVIRIFSELRREGIIKTNGRIIEIVDLQRLSYWSKVH